MSTSTPGPATWAEYARAYLAGEITIEDIPPAPYQGYIGRDGQLVPPDPEAEAG